MTRILITGAHLPLARFTAREFLRRGDTKVTLAGKSKNQKHTEEILQEVRSIALDDSDQRNRRIQTKDRVDFIDLDLNSMDSIEKFLKSVESKNMWIDVLINADTPQVDEIEKQSKKKRKDEKDKQLDPYYALFLGHYVLTRKLLDRMTYNGRIISSAFLGRVYRGAMVDYSGLKLKTIDGFIDSTRIRKPKSKGVVASEQFIYEDTKFALGLFTFELQRRFDRTNRYANLSAFAYHPTNLENVSLVLEAGKSPNIVSKIATMIWDPQKTYASPIVELATREISLLRRGGTYNNSLKLGELPKKLFNTFPTKSWEILWEASEKMAKDMNVRFDDDFVDGPTGSDVIQISDAQWRTISNEAPPSKVEVFELGDTELEHEDEM
eukprot:TRINITY_DN4231_c0_g1_i1.p1 TRINITY_DN4231_c0_g1~~TRINITY_DN4231_c0_g1_i1.p1  ORF type:complete len:381 (-),score=110.84 TRINITY_DN4231_c0_g1_i1:125-1267(-)